MSTKLKTIKNTGVDRHHDLQITEFWGGKSAGPCLQLTQGFGCTNLSDNLDEPGFIQVSKEDAIALLESLNRWLVGPSKENKQEDGSYDKNE